ncbi:hypothetical protein BOS5A_211315 [Bosea sp. EC-HK365B]|nr:hypothetical protein BOSE21B_50377 [Bosea sp. 21B]VVT60524.1 hypothetical protein BOS5A_211315 [Bosea sp. EC-HK365B]VXB65025.1 hypothetical protein BOSE127_140256 [Bosea sp. 127]
MRRFHAAEPFERDDLALRRQPDRQGTGARRLTVDQHRAGATFAKAAAEFRTVEAEVVAQEEQQRRPGFALDLMARAVDAKREALRRPHGSPERGEARLIVLIVTATEIVRIRMRIMTNRSAPQAGFTAHCLSGAGRRPEPGTHDHAAGP